MIHVKHFAKRLLRVAAYEAVRVITRKLLR